MKALGLAGLGLSLCLAAAAGQSGEHVDKPMDKSGKMDKMDKMGKMGEKTTVTGKLVDTKCWSMDKAHMGNDHGDMKDCGAMCAKMGIPVGIVADGKIHVLLAPAPELAGHVGMTCTAAGTMKPAGMLVDKLTCNGEEVKLGGMM